MEVLNNPKGTPTSLYNICLVAKGDYILEFFVASNGKNLDCHGFSGLVGLLMSFSMDT